MLRSTGPRTSARALGRRTASLALALLLALLVAVPLSALGNAAPASADANSRPSISVVQNTPATQPTGTAFSYTVTYACSNVNAATCATGGKITIPLATTNNSGLFTTIPKSWIQVGANPNITSWDVVGGNLVITLAPLTSTSGNIGITVTPPSPTTPNGISWSVKPTMTFTDGTPTVTTTAVASTATASASIDVTKTSASTNYLRGDTVDYTLAWECLDSVANAPGNEQLKQVVLVDTLPVGLTYVSSTPAGVYNAANRTITFTLTGAQLGDCAGGASPPGMIKVSATVNSTVANGAVLRNSVAATATSISSGTSTGSDYADVSIVATLPAGTVSKSGWGPVQNTIGDWNYYGTYWSATFPGNWLKGNSAANNPNSVLSYSNLADAFVPKIEALYHLDVDMGGAGNEATITDPMPCKANRSGAYYTSNAVGGALCTNPMFHPTMVTVHAGQDQSSANGGIPAGFAPYARLTDGTTVLLTAGPVPASYQCYGTAPAPNVPCRSYFVPTSAVGKVAELVFPRTAGMTNSRFSIEIGGYADASSVNTDILRNRGRIDSFRPGSPTAFGTNPTSDGNIYIKTGPLLGTAKYWSASNSTFELSAGLTVSGAVNGDLTFVDTLPAGVTYVGTPRFTYVGGNSSDLSSHSIPATLVTSADPNSGRTIVSVTVKASDINSKLAQSNGVPVGGIIYLSAEFTVSAPPGSYTNSVDATIKDPGAQPRCRVGAPVAGTPVGQTCRGSVDLVVNPTPGSDAVQVTKAVKGSSDADFKTFPAIGYVPAAGGNATFRLGWKNLSADSVNGVVAYDLLPRIGDTGTVAGTLNQPRNSSFTPTLTGLAALPAGVTASYSTSVNPCRPEVLPNAQNPGCTNDWQVLPANPSAALLATVKALRFTSSTTYASMASFNIDIAMSVPALTDASKVAWNTYASAQTNTRTGGVIPPVESPKVGIARSDFSHITFGKKVDKPMAANGDTLTYTVTVTNDGGRDIAAAVVKDTLPVGTTFVSATGGGTNAGGVITWNLSNLLLGETRSFIVTATVDASATGGSSLVNRVTVTGPPTNPETPCVDNATQACATTTVPDTGKLTVAKSSSPASRSTVTGGDEITYTLTFVATGNSAQTVDYTDDLTKVLDDATVSAQPTASPVTPLAVSTISGGRFTVTGSLRNQTVTVTYKVRVNSPTSGNGVLDNYLVKTGTTPPTTCATTDQLCTTHTVKQYSVEKSVSAVAADGTVTYTLLIKNTGQVAYTAPAPAKFSDDLSDVLDDATFVAGSASSNVTGWTFAGPSGTPASLVGSGPLAVGQTATITYRVKLKTPLGNRTLKNVVVPTDPTGVCAVGKCTTTTDLPDLGVKKESSPASGTQVVPGQVVSYTLTFTNQGRADAAVDYTDDLKGLLDDGKVTTAPTASGSGLAVAYTAGATSFRVQGTVRPNETITVTYKVTVDNPVTGDRKLLNFVVKTGTTPPTACVPDPIWPTCTEHPVQVQGELLWKKVDPAGAALRGSEWVLTAKNVTGVPAGTQTAITDCVAASASSCSGPDKDPVAGQFRISGIVSGDYELSETKAPAGFKLLTSPIPVTIGGGTKTLPNIVNVQQTVPAIPLTGGLGADHYLMAGGALLALMLGLGGWELRRRRRSTTA